METIRKPNIRRNIKLERDLLSSIYLNIKIYLNLLLFYNFKTTKVQTMIHNKCNTKELKKKNYEEKNKYRKCLTENCFFFIVCSYFKVIVFFLLF